MTATAEGTALPVIVTRLLADEFTLHCETATLTDAITPVANRATQDEIPLRARHDWQVSGRAGAYLLRDDRGETATIGTLAALRNRVLVRMAELSLDAWSDHGHLQAAVGRHDGRAVLLVGGPQSGKTVLALALQFAGVEMIGDHLALVGGGRAVAYPRRFEYWETAISLLPGLPAHARSPLRIGGRGQQYQIQLDPLDLGRPWRLRPDPIGWIFCLEPNFYGQSSLRRCSPAEALRYILPNCSLPKIGGPLWAARFYALLDQVQPAILTLGTLETAVEWIHRALADGVAAEQRTA